MTKLIPKIAALVMLAGLATGQTGCNSLMPTHSESRFPAYPLDSQVAELKKTANFKIGGSRGDEHYWTFNGLLIDADSAPALSATGFDTPNLVITNVTLANCGFYKYQDVGGVSETAQLLVAERDLSPRLAATTTAGSPIVVYGTPIAGGGGGGTTCPGPYVGYVEYVNPQSSTGGWSFPNGGTAIDSQGNAVVYYGVPFTNHGCGPTIGKGVYHFYIFFKGAVPSKPYPIKLTMY